MPARTRRSRILRSTPLLLVAAGAIAQPTDYDGHSVVRVEVGSRADVERIEALGLDIWTHTPRRGGLDVRVPPGGADLLRRAGFDPQTLIPDLGPIIRAERAGADVRGAGWFDDFKTYAQISSYVDDLVTEFPAMASRFEAGLSLENRSIFGVRIAAPGEGGGPAPQRPAVVLNACQHAREWVSPMTAMFIADSLLRGYGVDPEITAALDEVEFHIIPVVNPDGYIYSWTDQRLWRKNRRNNGGGDFGVDNNRNWGFEWGGEGSSGDPGNELYRGTAPFSEPETQAIRDYLLSLDEVRAHIDFHSFGQLILSPWGWTEDPTPEDATFQAAGDQMAQAIADFSGATYVSGPVSTTLYLAAGGACDWVYGALGAYSWTIELRDTGVNGFILPPSLIGPTVTENLEAILSLAGFASSEISIRLAEGFPTSLQPFTPTTVSVEIDTLFGAEVDPGTAVLRWRLEGAQEFNEAPLTPDGEVWSATLPGLPCGGTAQIEFEASTLAGDTATIPEDGEEPYSLGIVNTLIAFDDAAEAATGWTLGVPSDDADTGEWINADPVGTPAQPENDHTPDPGVRCFITGNASPGSGVGTADVDGGVTTLISPIMDASGEGEAFLVYHRWYSNDQGGSPNADSMPIHISNDGGSTWTLLEDVSENANAWIRREFRIADFVAPTAQVRVRFVARDLGTGSIVEAGVDDLRVVLIAPCGLAGDVDGDGEVSFADLNLVLSDYNQTGEPGEFAADLDGDGDVDFADLNIVLSNYGQTAP